MSSLPKNIWCIVPAAGIGSRFGAEIPKQYFKLGEQPILLHTLDCLLQCDQIRKITLCLAPDDQYWQQLGFSDSRMQITQGGSSRADSVLNGLLALKDVAEQSDWVLVHDAARPCLSIKLLNDLVNELKFDEVGGILALPASDTLKEVASVDSRAALPKVTKTLNRTAIWHAQTPQMFRYGLLHKALEQAKKNHTEITDESSAIEALGLQPKVVLGDAHNLKITTAGDLALADFFLTRPNQQ